MLHLRTFGALSLTDGDAPGRGAAQQRKTLALLALLAAAGRAGLSRDKLLSYLWPEADAEHGRGLLKQACYALRRDLHAPDLFLGTSQLRLNPDVITSDVQTFEAALERTDLASAAHLYSGPFLDGFYLSDAPEFERWAEAQRSRLQKRAVVALERLATEADGRGDSRGAVEWWRELAAIDPLNSRVVLGFMRSLAAVGDRPGALQAARAHEKLVREELDASPDPAIRELAEHLVAESARSGAKLLAVSPAVSAELDVAGTVAQASPRSPWMWKRLAVALAMVVIGLVSGRWLLHGALLGTQVDESPGTPRRIAVLPFRNLGPADQEYFADGITEEIAARLSPIKRLQVIGRTSPNRYKQTEKTIPEIGRELDVSYVLEGSVRWESSPQGRARVRITPLLVRTMDGARVWAEVYDEPLDEIFRVQSDIAQKVVRALDVILLDPQRRAVETVPTRSIEAYEYYLRGNEFMKDRGLEPRYAYAAVQMYEKAVALDPKFTLAYARLARINSRIYWFYYDRSENRLARAKAAIDKAVELEPDRPEVRLALGSYYWMCYLDYDRALREMAIAEVGLPNEPDLLTPRAVLRMRQGDFRKGFEDYAKALQLDPGSALIAHNYAVASNFHRAHDRADSLFGRAIALAPDWNEPYFERAANYLLWKGNTQRARAILAQVQAIGVTDGPTLLLHQVRIDLLDRKYQDALGHLASGVPEAINWHFNFIPRAQLYADVYSLMQRPDLARAYYDSARTLAYNKLQQQPNDPRFHRALGIAYAGLGRKEDAIKEGRMAVELLPPGEDAGKGYRSEWDLARIYTMVGEHDAALERLEYLLSIPGWLTPAWLRIDPTWDPLRADPRFQRLVSRAN